MEKRVDYQKSTSDSIEGLVNSCSFSPMEVGIRLSRIHRYLQQELGKMMLHYLGMLAKNYRAGFYDGRNEYISKCADVMIRALEQEGLFNLDFNDRNFYDKINEKINNE